MLSDDEEALDYEVESEASGSADEVMDTDEDDSDEEDEEEESRMLVQLEGFGELELPVGVDIDQLRKLQQHPEIPFKVTFIKYASVKMFIYLLSIVSTYVPVQYF